VAATDTLTRRPSSTKGPLVLLDMDQQALDAAYDQSKYAPNREQVQARRDANSAVACAVLGEPLRLAYGATEIEKLDVYRTKRPHGTLETPEFQRQTRDFAAAVKAAGKPVEFLVGESYNHFELLETLASPFGLLGRAALKLMKL